MRNWRKLFILGILTLLVSNLMTPLTLFAENAADQNDGEPEGEVIKAVSYTHLILIPLYPFHTVPTRPVVIK